MKARRRVLMIAHYFPPGTSSGTLRTVKFAKYLPENGWQPFVLTMQPDAYHADRRDLSLLDEISRDLRIFRTPVWMPDRALSRLKRLLVPGRQAGAGGEGLPRPAGSSGRRAPGLLEQARDWLQFPDAYGGWFLPGLWRACRIMKEEHIDLIYSTAPSPVAHMIALWLKKWTGAPWVADFRDPWECLFPEAVYVDGQHPWRARAEVAVAEKVVRSADLVVANTERLCQAFRCRFPDVAPRRFVPIPNGFDAEDFQGLAAETQAARPFTIAHTGTFFGSLRSPDEVLTAIAELVSSGELPPERLSVKLVGCGSFGTAASPYLQILARVSHRESLQIMAQSDVLLLLQQSPKYWLQVPAKTYEYIASRKWILAVAPDGATRDIVRRLPNGLVVTPGRSEELKTAVLSLYRKFCAGELYPVPVDPGAINRYSRREQTRELAGYFSELVHDPVSIAMGSLVNPV